jgi:hypothetical protein
MGGGLGKKIRPTGEGASDFSNYFPKLFFFKTHFDSRRKRPARAKSARFGRQVMTNHVAGSEAARQRTQTEMFTVHITREFLARNAWD